MQSSDFLSKNNKDFIHVYIIFIEYLSIMYTDTSKIRL